MGIAIQLPLDDGRGNVEFSICMEANYNQPQFEPELSPELFQTVSICINWIRIQALMEWIVFHLSGTMAGL